MKTLLEQLTFDLKVRKYPFDIKTIQFLCKVTARHHSTDNKLHLQTHLHIVKAVDSQNSVDLFETGKNTFKLWQAEKEKGTHPLANFIFFQP